MSNNKQSMKLYTEEQVRKAIELAQECDHDGYYPVHFDYSQTEILQHLTHIELPSDSLCINCDESKSTHNLCMDCMIKIGKENIELPSDEEILDLGPFKSTLPYNVVFYDGWLEGATLIRNLIIKRGNNEQQ